MLEIARIAGIVGSPVMNTSFAELLTKSDAVNAINPWRQGYIAGTAGDDHSGNPHVPGADNFARWSTGWHDGQKKLGAELFPSKEKAAGKMASEGKSRKPRAKKVKRSSGKALH